MACKGKNQHVVTHPKGWAVRGENNTRASRVLPTQRQTIRIARQIAFNQRSELVIHGRNGQIREKDSHGFDAFPPKG